MPTTAEIARDVKIDHLLRELQEEVERRNCSQAERDRRRLILKGMRIACWALAVGSTPASRLRAELRAELFHLPVPTGTASGPTPKCEVQND